MRNCAKVTRSLSVTVTARSPWFSVAFTFSYLQKRHFVDVSRHVIRYTRRRWSTTSNKKKIAISLLINERVIKRKRVASHVSHTNDTRCMRADVIRDVEERGSILEKGFEFWSLLASDFSLCQRNETFFPMWSRGIPSRINLSRMKFPNRRWRKSRFQVPSWTAQLSHYQYTFLRTARVSEPQNGLSFLLRGQILFGHSFAVY